MRFKLTNIKGLAKTQKIVFIFFQPSTKEWLFCLKADKKFTLKTCIFLTM